MTGTRRCYCLRALVSRLTGCGGGGSRRLGEVRIVKRPGDGTGSPGCHRTMDPGIDATAPVEPAGPCAAAASTKPNAKTRPNAKRNHMLSSEGSRHCWKTVSPACGGAYAKSAELSRAVLPHGEISFAQAIEPLLIQAERYPLEIRGIRVDPHRNGCQQTDHTRLG